MGCGNDAALLSPAFCGKPSKVETSAAVVDHIGHKAGTVKTAGTVSSPNIRRAQILFCLGNQLSGFSGGLNLNRIKDASDIQIEVGIKAVIPIAERKCHFARTANLGDGLSLCDFGANGNSEVGAAADFHGVPFFISEGNDSTGNSHYLPIHNREHWCATGNKNLHLAVLNDNISGTLITIAIQDAVVPIQVNGRTEHDAIALGNLVNVIHLSLIGIEAVEQNALKIGGGEGNITDVHGFFLGDGNGAAVTASIVGIPFLVPVIQSGLMAVIVHIEVHTVPGKVAGILHLVERAVHDDLRTHGQTGIVRVYGNGMVCSRIDTGGGWTARPYTTADGTAAIGTCDHLTDIVANLNRPGSNTGLSSDFFGKVVLQVENGFQFRLYLIESEILILGAQVADEHGGIVANLRQVVVIFLTAGVTGFHSIDLLLKLGFEFRVVGIRAGDLDIISRP